MLAAPKLTVLSGNEIYCMRLNGLSPCGVEIFAVGTAVRHHAGLKIVMPALPAQAIIRDKDPVSDYGGFEMQTLRAGN